MNLLQEDLAGKEAGSLPKYTMAVTVMMTGVAAHKIRRFEEFGLCLPFRTFSKQRLYSDNDIELIRKISAWEKDGVNLAGIKVILNLQNSKENKEDKPCLHSEKHPRPGRPAT